ncbi:MAG: hypothetical protein ACN4GR_02945 [Arenicellales bacterium]
MSRPNITNKSHLMAVGTLHALTRKGLHIFHAWLILEIEMKPFVAIFTLLTLFGCQIVFADEEKKTATETAASSTQEKAADKKTIDKKDADKEGADKKAAEEEPDCD